MMLSTSSSLAWAWASPAAALGSGSPWTGTRGPGSPRYSKSLSASSAPAAGDAVASTERSCRALMAATCCLTLAVSLSSTKVWGSISLPATLTYILGLTIWTQHSASMVMLMLSSVLALIVWVYRCSFWAQGPAISSPGFAQWKPCLQITDDEPSINMAQWLYGTYTSRGFANSMTPTLTSWTYVMVLPTRRPVVVASKLFLAKWMGARMTQVPGGIRTTPRPISTDSQCDGTLYAKPTSLGPRVTMQPPSNS
mmetsp:Transcript_35242/g.59160  ORF Transcript_35242/g.59160 Transcript_35242/m.59160 type:complete len:253 (+) Transcript_35242:1122-1880(+)